MSPLRLAAVLFLFCGLGLGLQGAETGLSGKKQDLRTIKKGLKDARNTVASEQKQEKKLLKELSSLGNKVDAARRDLRTHERNLKVVEARLETLSRRSSRFETDIKANREALRHELKALWKMGRVEPLAMLFSSRDPGELVSRWRFLSSLAALNSRRIRDTRDKVASLESYRREYGQKEAELKEHKERAQAARAQAEVEKRGREALLGQVRAKRSKAEELVKDLSGAARELEDLVRSLQGASKRQAPVHHVDLDEGPSRLGRRGSLPWPVRGRILSRFGEHMHPRFPGVKVFNRGVEIAAAPGTEVGAVGPGVVRFAGAFEGFGQMVVLDHGSGWFTVYGNNSEVMVSEGESVERGQKIAETGDSLNLDASTLYFEIRAQAKAMDPALWLKRRP